MFMLFAAIPAFLLAWSLRGRFEQLVAVRLRHAWLIWLSLAVQVVLFTPLGSWFPRDGLPLAHAATYLPIIAFLALNTSLGLGLLAVGVTSNFIAIAVNGGLMPADPRAQAVIFGAEVAGRHTNTDSSADRLAVLGDTMALPSWFPFANAFSIGDVLIAVGLVWAVARLTRPTPDGDVEGTSDRPRRDRTTNARALIASAGAVTLLAASMVAASDRLSSGFADSALQVGALLAALAVGCVFGVVMASRLDARPDARALGMAIVFAGLGLGLLATATLPMTALIAVWVVGASIGGARGAVRSHGVGLRRAVGPGALPGVALGLVAGDFAAAVIWAACWSFIIVGVALIAVSVGGRSVRAKMAAA